MIKRITTLVFVFLTIVGNAVWGQMQVSISTAEEMRAFAKSVNENTDNSVRWDVTLEANIDLGGESNPWTPIEEFSGTFDGKGNTITGLFIKGNSDETEKNSYGLFGCPRQGATIQNVKIEEGYICYTGNSHVYIGGIVAGGNGVCGNLKIDNCSFDGLIDVTIDSYAIGMNAIGGILGGFESNGPTISSCCYKGEIKVSLKGLEDTYGYASYAICGIGKGNEILNSYNEGDISVEVENVTAMQIQVCGISDALGKISSCYNTGDITVNTVGNNASAITSLSIGGITGANLYNAIEYCYNTGEISSNVESAKIGSIIGLDNSEMTYIKNYYLEGDGNTAIGSSEESSEELISVSNEQFESGEIAWNLRDKGGYGQNLDEYGKAIDETPVLLCFAGDEQKVYKLTLESDAITKISGDIYRNAEPAKLLQQEVYDELIADAEEGKDLIWKNTEGEVVAIGNDYTPSTDETLTAEWGDVYTINTVVEPAGAGTILVQAKAQEGDEISFTVTANEGYELASVSAGEVALAGANGSYLFTMPATNVTITATFNKVETEQPGDDDDEDQGDTGIHKPQRPIKYYNIYVDTICPGLNVEVSKDVVQEGHQVSAYLTIQAECDTTGMRFEYKRGLFGYWKDLKELEGVQPGEYIIKNIYTDIYIRALDATLPEEEPTGIENLEGVKAYAKEGSIYVYTPNREEVIIISMSGAIIKHAEQIGLQSYTVNRGIYIVRIGENFISECGPISSGIWGFSRVSKYLQADRK